MNDENEFIATKGYLRFKEFCDACIEYKYIGICYGPPGVGKTKSAEQYSGKPLEDTIPKNQFGNLITSEAPKELHNCQTILYTPMPPFSPHQINSQLLKEQLTLNGIVKEANINRIRHEQPELSEKNIDSLIEGSIMDNKDYFKLIIIDETERLNVTGLEILRALYDKLNVSFIFIGMPGIKLINP